MVEKINKCISLIILCLCTFSSIIRYFAMASAYYPYNVCTKMELHI